MTTFVEKMQRMISSDTLVVADCKVGDVLTNSATGKVTMVAQNVVTGAKEGIETTNTGQTIVERISGAAIAVGEFVVSAAAGVVPVGAVGIVVDGVALDAASGPGQPVRVCIGGICDVLVGATAALAPVLTAIKTDAVGRAGVPAAPLTAAVPPATEGSVVQGVLLAAAGAAGTLVSVRLFPNLVVPGTFT